jgi:2-methylcitrate dehydratase PrpD
MSAIPSSRGETGSFAPVVAWLNAQRGAVAPAEVTAAAKQCLLDGAACLIGGAHTGVMDSYRKVLAANTVAADGAVPVGGGLRAGLLDAVHFYGQAANILDFDDCYRHDAPSHPGSTIIGTALACGSVEERSGKDLLTAITSAYEVSLRFGAALCPSDLAPSKDIGYATWQTFGAFVAAGTLLDLTPEQWEQGFGLAAQQAPISMIVRANPDGRYTWLKNGYGPASAAGTLAAMLAREGFVGDQHFFSEHFGFWKAYGSDRFRPECLATLPGSDWLIKRVEFKPWACCRWAQTTIEAVLQVKPAIRTEDIESIEILGFKDFCDTLDSPFPLSQVDAQFNVRYLVAIALLRKNINPALLGPVQNHERLIALASRIRVTHSPEMDDIRRKDLSIPARAVFQFKDGSRKEAFIAEPMGSPARGGTSMDDTIRKFQSTLHGLMPGERLQKIVDIVLSVECHDARYLLEAMFP